MAALDMSQLSKLSDTAVSAARAGGGDLYGSISVDEAIAFVRRLRTDAGSPEAVAPSVVTSHFSRICDVLEALADGADGHSPAPAALPAALPEYDSYGGSDGGLEGKEAQAGELEATEKDLVDGDLEGERGPGDSTGGSLEQEGASSAERQSERDEREEQGDGHTVGNEGKLEAGEHESDVGSHAGEEKRRSDGEGDAKDGSADETKSGLGPAVVDLSRDSDDVQLRRLKALCALLPERPGVRCLK